MQIKISFAAAYDFNQLIHAVCSPPRRFWPLPRPAPHCGEGGVPCPAPSRRFFALPLPAPPRPVKKIASPPIPGEHRDELAIGLLLGGLSLHWLLTISLSAYSQYFFLCIFTIFGHKSKLGRTAVDISSWRTSAAILQNNSTYIKSFNRKKSTIAYIYRTVRQHHRN